MSGFEQRWLYCQLSLLQQHREGQHPQLTHSLAIQKFIREHQADIDAAIEADRQAQANALSGPLWATFAATFGGGPPPPPSPGEDKKDVEPGKEGENDGAVGIVVT